MANVELNDILTELIRLDQRAADDTELFEGICTLSADWLQNRLGGKVVGYFSEDNPSALLGEAEGGHDFLVVGDYLVDWWAWSYYGKPAILHLIEDDTTIKRLYGNWEKWETP